MRNRIISLCITTGFLLAECTFGQNPAVLSESGPEAKIAYPLAGARIPLWAGGTFVELESSGTAAPNVLAFNKLGQQTINSALIIPDVAKVDVYDYARGTDGTIALCGYAFAADGTHAPYLAYLSSDGSESRVIRLGSYSAFRVAVDPDGTLWTLGYEMINGSESHPGVDPAAGVIRHYDRSGKQVASFVSRSTVTEKGNLNYGRLVVSSDRIGWYPFLGGQKGIYTEVLKSGQILTYPLPVLESGIDPRSVAGIAMTVSNDVFVAISGQKKSGIYLYRLDRLLRSWSRVDLPIALSGQKAARLLGSQDNDLAFLFADSTWGTQAQAVRFYRAGR